MKKHLFIVVLLFLFLACQDKETDSPEIPVWLGPRIAELESSGCGGCTITRYVYKEEYYYHVYCNNWSCVYCELYHYNGTLVVWDEDTDHVDFEQNKDRPVKIWECQGGTTGP